MTRISHSLRRRRAAAASVRRFADRATAADGFTLIEVLVVILVIAVLCGIAIPLLTAQKAKASNAQAKELARTAETTAEVIATQNEGSYAAVSREELHRMEPTIPIAASAGTTYLSAATSAANEYALTATTPEGNQLIVRRSPSGAISRECRSPVTKTGCAGGETSTW
jgi:type IV pilus assembly protein PilA